MGIGKFYLTICSILFLILASPDPKVFGQILEFDQNPPSLSWRQINTPNFQVIYPSEFEQQAQQLSTKLEEVIIRVEADLGIKPRKTSILFQNQSVLPNGFVQLAPRRSEFVVTPPVEGEVDAWLNHLAIHELRHVVQFDKLVGHFKAPFWEQLGLAIFGITLPSWFFEGDAVRIETRLTQGGRGRIPSWAMPLRTNLLEGKKFSYQKNYLGSYRDITAGSYEIGYFMTEKLHRDFGDNVTSNLLERISSNLLRPYNLSQGLRHITGHSSWQWHQQTMEELLADWQAQADSLHTQDYRTFPLQQNRTPSSWLLPQALPNGDIMALHYAYDTPPEIMLMDSTGRKKKTLVQIGWQTSYNFSYAAGKIVWDELRKNPRYAKQTFSVIKSRDFITGKTRQLTSKSRLFTPALSPSGDIIACVEIGQDNQGSLVLLDWQDGSVLERFSVPDGWALQTPAFDQSGKRVISVVVSEKGTNLLEISLETGHRQLLLDWEHQQVERPIYHGDNILFKAHYDGIDNIFAVPVHTSSIQKITHAKYGAFNPSISPDGDLIFNQYGPQGYQISRSSLDYTVVQTDLQAAQPFEKQILGSEYPGETPAQDRVNWVSQPYKELSNLINFHSLSVTSGDYRNLDQLNPGVYWLSDNLLNTLQARLGYVYNSNISRSEYHAQLTYQRYFPKFSISYQNRGRLNAVQIDSLRGDNLSEQETEEPTMANVRWREHLVRFNMSVPLSFYKGNQAYSLGIQAGTSLTQRYGLALEDQNLLDKARERFVPHIRFPLEYTAYFGRNTRRSILELAPRWGQHLSVSYRHIPLGSPHNKVSGKHFSLRSTFYLPGIARTHSTSLQINYQNGAGTYASANSIPLVSGFDQLGPTRVHNTVLVNYRFPLAYPDWEIGPLAFIKRLKGGLFADFQNISRSKPSSLRPKTFGLEVRSDLNLLRFYLPNFDLGTRLIYAPDNPTGRRVLQTFSLSYSY